MKPLRQFIHDIRQLYRRSCDHGVICSRSSCGPFSRKRRIRGLVLVLAFSCTPLVACFQMPSPPSLSQATQEIIDYVDAYGLYAVGPEWEEARASVLSAVTTANTWEDIAPELEAAIAVAGGDHSRVVWEKDHQQIPLGQPFPMDRGNVTILRLPTAGGSSVEELESYSKQVAELIELRRTSVCGWIVDLRGNGGGGTYPLIAGLGAILPDGTMYSNRDRQGRQSTWVLQGNDLMQGVPESVPIPPYGEPLRPDSLWVIGPYPKITGSPVAVLQDSGTASAAEYVLAALRSIPGSRTFGDETAGLTSGNAVMDIPNGPYIVLTVTTLVDPNGTNWQDEPIPPDQETMHPLTDALLWLNEKECTTEV